jgi:hypothetical protein
MHEGQSPGPKPTNPFLRPLIIYLFPVDPIWSIEHPWNASWMFQFLNLSELVGLWGGGGISLMQGCYIHMTTQTDIHALSGIWTHNPTVRAGKDISCLKPRDHCISSHSLGLRKWQELPPIQLHSSMVGTLTHTQGFPLLCSLALHWYIPVLHAKN